MKEYICIKELCLDLYDDDGFYVENETAYVEVGEIFQRSEDSFRCVADRDSIRLENDEHWLEISEETLNDHFKLLEGE